MMLAPLPAARCDIHYKCFSDLAIPSPSPQCLVGLAIGLVRMGSMPGLAWE